MLMLLGSIKLNYAQTSHLVTLTLNQPAALVVDAGIDVNANTGQVVNIGGNPAATGGALPYTYSWSPAAGLSDPTIANPDLTVGNETTYVLNVTDANGCSVSTSLSVSVGTGITDLKTTLFKIYPNPASSNLTIETEHENAQLTIADAQGSIVKANKLTQKISNIDVRGLAAGTYSVQLIHKGKKQTAKITIQ